VLHRIWRGIIADTHGCITGVRQVYPCTPTKIIATYRLLRTDSVARGRKIGIRR
jgi:hypothetical protein